jgi:hypothetical protein
MSELAAFQFFAKYLLRISIDDGTFGTNFGYVLKFLGFRVETDVGINRCFAPFWRSVWRSNARDALLEFGRLV